MLSSLKEKGVFTAILLRFEKYTLPRALALKAKVDSGETLSDYDIDFLKKILGNIHQFKTLIDQQPEYHALESRAIWLYTQIISIALKNETKG